MADAYLVYDEAGSIRNDTAWSEGHRQAAAEMLSLFGSDGELTDRIVVDIGCGDGEKSKAFLDLGARCVIGIDTDIERIQRAQSISDNSSKIRFEVIESDRFPLQDSSVDIALLVNVMEHVAEPELLLKECARVLKDGGLVLCVFKTWFSPRGSHINDWIYIPWNHLLFPEWALVRVLRRMAEINPFIYYHFPALRESPLPKDLVALADGGLNRMSLRRFRRLIARSSFQLVSQRLTGYGFNSTLKPVRLVRYLARVRLVNELFGGWVVTVLRRPNR
jgi:SAM-dependent methyltransferase